MRAWQGDPFDDETTSMLADLRSGYAWVIAGLSLLLLGFLGWILGG